MKDLFLSDMAKIYFLFFCDRQLSFHFDIEFNKFFDSIPQIQILGVEMFFIIGETIFFAFDKIASKLIGVVLFIMALLVIGFSHLFRFNIFDIKL